MANSGANLIADLSNTATLNIILPAGVSITASESGTLLEAINPIPIPGLFPLVLVLGVWVASLKRRSENHR